MSEITYEDIEVFLKEARKHKPYEMYSEHWKTEAAYFTWIRGRLRQLWQKWPPRNELKKEKRVRAPVLGEDGNQIVYKTGKKKGRLKYRWELPCEQCGGVYPQSQVEADHLEPAGACTNAVQVGTFLYRLLVSKDKLRLLCKPCHKIITYSERMGISFEDARRAKIVIEFTDTKKNSVVKQKEELIGYGFTEDEISNATKRKAAYAEIVQREIDAKGE